MSDEIKRLRAEVERMEALFQRTHHVHWQWVAKAVEAEDARAEEREACAKLCEKAAVEASSIGALAGISASWAADAIRARGGS